MKLLMFNTLVIKPPLLLYPIILILSILVVSFNAWQGTFWLDDYSNIVNIPQLNKPLLHFNEFIEAALSGISSMIGRPVSMLSFAINSYLTGINPYFYKLTNTLIHISNAILVYMLSLNLLLIHLNKNNTTAESGFIANSQHVHLIAFFISLIWAISPININASLYVVQRMNELASLFTLMGCLLYIQIRTLKNYTNLYQFLFFLIISLFTILAILSKENGILLIPLIILLEYYLYAHNTKTFNPFFLKLTLAILVIIPLIISFFYYDKIIDNFLDYSMRYYSLYERLLTQSRVLIIYIKQTLFPNIFTLTLYHDDIILSSSLTKPLTTLWSSLFLIAWLISSFLLRKSFPWFIFSTLWFFITHSIESTFLPLEIMYEHRNYLPSFALSFFIVIGLYQLMIQFPSKKIQTYYFSLLTIYSLFLLYSSFMSSLILSNNVTLFSTYNDNHPKSYKSQLLWGGINEKISYTNLNDKNYLELAFKHYSISSTINKNSIAGLTKTIILKQYNQIDFNAEMKELLKRLSKIKITSMTVLSLQNLLRANQQLSLPLSPKIINQIFLVLLDNPQNEGEYRAIMHKEYADYLISQQSSDDKILTELYHAVMHYPAIELKIYLVKNLIKVQRYDEAKIIMKEIDDNNSLNRYSKIISDLKKQLQLNQH